MTDNINQSDTRRSFNLGGRGKLALVGAGLLALGGAAGAVVMAESRPSVTMAPVQPIAIRALASDEIVTIRGRVAEIYGNKFVMADASGRALVETGREGEGGLATVGEPVTVQGRFERGAVHASFLVAPGNKITALGPIGGPRPGRHGPGGPRGDDHGPDRDGPPPPPPMAAPRDAAAAPAGAAPAPAPAQAPAVAAPAPAPAQ